MASPSQNLRALFAQRETTIIPGAYDAITARMIEQADFPAVYLSGSALASSALAQPDVGLLNLNDVLETARRMVLAVNIPVLVDIDQGFGNAVNLTYAVSALEQVGVAGIQLEDQPFPKRCGHMEGKHVVPATVMVGKIKAVIESRRSDLLIVARTDSRAVYGIDEAIRRGNLYAQAGADVIFPEAPESVDELKRFAHEIHAPLLANMTEWGKTPLLSAAELQEIGFKAVLFPVSTLRVSFKAVSDFLSELKQAGTQKHLLGRMKTRQELYELTGYRHIQELEERFVLDESSS